MFVVFSYFVEMGHTCLAASPPKTRTNSDDMQTGPDVLPEWELISRR